jgi:hypothetical protein
MTDPRPTPPERVPVADLIREARTQAASFRGPRPQFHPATLTALAAALEATAAERGALAAMLERAQETLREIAPVLDAAADQAAALNEPEMSADLDAALRRARERLESP